MISFVVHLTVILILELLPLICSQYGFLRFDQVLDLVDVAIVIL